MYVFICSFLCNITVVLILVIPLRFLDPNILISALDHQQTNWRLHICAYFINILRSGQNHRHFPDDIFKCIVLNENVWISLRINNIPVLAQIMAWHRSGDAPLSEPMVVSFQMHICPTRPQWVNSFSGYGWVCVIFIEPVDVNPYDQWVVT